jgi:hypothetical protein
MRFMMLMYPGPQAESGVIPDEKIFAEMNKYNEELQKAGVLLALDGLQPSAKGARLSVKHGKKTITDGPFPEAKELIGGYWMIQVRSREEAIEWLKRVPLHDDVARVELRQVYELTDFSPSVQEINKPLAEKLQRG